MKRLLALMLCASIGSPGCAARMSSAGGVPYGNPQVPERANGAVMADYIKQLPIGARVRIVLTSGKELHAVLMKNVGDPIVVQRRARIPEPPFELALRDVAAMEVQTGSGSPGRTAAVSAAAAAGATLGVLMLLAAIFSD